MVLDRAGSAPAPHREALGHQGGDPVGDPGRVGLGGVVGQELGLHPAGVLPRRAADQPLAVAVGSVPQLGAHELLEEIVHPGHYTGGRAEVGVQGQQGVFALCPLRRAGPGQAPGQQGPGIQFFPEDAGVGLAEAIDALFQVPHQKAVIPRGAGEAPVNGILQSVGILVFVHHHRAEPGPDLSTEGGGLAVLPPQKPEGQVLEVAELQ